MNIISHVEVIPEEQYGWYYVKTTTGKKGYVYGELLAKGKDADAIRRETVTTVQYSSSNNSSNSSDSNSSNKTTGNKKTYQEYAKNLCEEKYNWGEEEFEDLIELWEYESNWDPTCSYGSCYGIPQRNARSHGMPDSYRKNWKNQIQWCLEYIEGRYGTPSKAWTHFCNYNWY